MKILLAIDGSTCSDAAVEEVARRPWPTGSEVKIISVVEPPFVPATEPWAISSTDLEDMGKALHDKALLNVEGALSCNAFPISSRSVEEMGKALHDKALLNVEGALLKLRMGLDKTLKLTTDLPTGYPGQMIVDIAEAWGADLIVVGSHGYGAWSRFLLGSVSNAVATHARCSVEIVRCPQSSESAKKQS